MAAIPAAGVPLPDHIRNALAAGDPLTGVLQNVHVRALVLGEVEFTAPWGLRLPAVSGGFFLVHEGRMLVSADMTPQWHAIEAGELGIVLSGEEHMAGDAPHMPAARIIDVFPPALIQKSSGDLKYGGGGAACRVVMGGFQFEGAVRPPIGLPRFIHLDKSMVGQSMLTPLVEILAEQARNRAAGSRAVTSHLAGSLLVEAIRLWVRQRSSGQPAPVMAVLDQHLGPVLGLLHERPERTWSLQELANEAGLSRTVFCERFLELVGKTPLEYLREQRMHLAAMMLTTGSPDIRLLARRTGYASQGAFCTAFKRWARCTPGEYQRAQRPPA